MKRFVSFRRKSFVSFRRKSFVSSRKSFVSFRRKSVVSFRKTKMSSKQMLLNVVLNVLVSAYSANPSKSGRIE